jgi:DNA repair exonuclease SbcCD ATPase subunit
MALVRCSKCGNPVSSKSKVCPICGEPQAGEQVSTTIVDKAVESSSKTLNDIIAERNRERTLNDTHRVEESVDRTISSSEVRGNVNPPVSMSSEPKYEEQDNGAYSNAHIDDLNAELERNNRSLKGYKMIALVLLLLLIPAAYFGITYGLKFKTIEGDYAIVESARQLFEEQNSLLQRDAESLVKELEDLKDQNDTMMVKYQEAVVMLEQLQKEKTYNYNQLAKYKREVETLRGVMKGYLRQIDSLNTINSNLHAENVAYQKEITSAQLRADVAEEKADELNTKVRIGAVIRASGIRMVALNDKSSEVRRIKLAKRLRVDFELTANELAEPGEKSIYICITPPDGYVLSSNELIPFNFEGTEMMASAMRKVDYENQSVPVSIFYDGAMFEKGTYKVDIYIDGRHSGSQEKYFE